VILVQTKTFGVHISRRCGYKQCTRNKQRFDVLNVARTCLCFDIEPKNFDFRVSSCNELVLLTLWLYRPRAKVFYVSMTKISPFLAGSVSVIDLVLID
jgi:hypothetical protein